MASHVIDEFVTIFRLKLDDFKSGAREIDDESRKLKDGQKKTFDAIEQSGRKAGETIKGVTREVVGLGLAFMGAKSITGFLANMAAGAASADRFGQMIGMSVKQIWAWRSAMKGFGGAAGDADSSLQRIQSAKMQYQRGQMGPQEQNQWGMLGITGNDLRTGSAGDILQKLAGSRLRTTNPQFYSDSLMQIGLSGPMVSMLMQGQDAVNELIQKYEANADGQEELAKETEKLQEELATLNTQYMKALVPILQQMLPVFQAISGFLGKMTDTPQEAKDTLSGAAAGAAAGGLLGGLPGAAIGAVIGGIDGWGVGSVARGNAKNLLPGSDHGQVRIPLPNATPAGADPIVTYFMRRGLSGEQALGIRAGIHAEGGSLGMAANGAFGLGQWRGSRRRELFRRYGHSPSMMQQLEFLWWELNGGDHGGRSVLAQRTAHGTMASYFRDFMRPQGRNNERYRDLIADMDRGRKYLARAGAGVNIGQITVHTQARDANGIAGSINGAMQRRISVAKADPMVRP
ncbi:phage tail tip lysozyme [Novosphingobium olei]|uniref:Phage tail lysozyme domain-containing protein n=1 Tax=Novosphingobium olei TaxID=2728851 RepID=A0A7Y0BNM8_9SPHN|nr:phage tail tip lysozyme [Novosphingobium olei]NML93807.1 hypothetical protein [Novosphingobium olei]